MNRPEGLKKVFVAATGQDQGKTTVSLGLMAAFTDLCPPTGFIKPVGQRYVEIDGVRVDEDVALMRSIFPAGCAMADMSPVTVGRSFTRDYIQDPHPDVLNQRILDSFGRMAEGMRSVVIEGTGHAGVGSCFDTSNAYRRSPAQPEPLPRSRGGTAGRGAQQGPAQEASGSRRRRSDGAEAQRH